MKALLRETFNRICAFVQAQDYTTASFDRRIVLILRKYGNESVRLFGSFSVEPYFFSRVGSFLNYFYVQLSVVSLNYFAC